MKNKKYMNINGITSGVATRNDHRKLSTFSSAKPIVHCALSIFSYPLSILSIALLLMIGGKVGTAYAQLTDYTFSTGSTSKWITLSSPTSLLETAKDDNASSLTDIGFTFEFGGNSYTKFWVNSNGVFSFASTTSSSSTSGQFTSSSASTAVPKISGIARDLTTGSNGYVKYKLTGSSPNYILVCEYYANCYGITGQGTSGSATMKWQVQLHQNGNKVVIAYNTASTAPTNFQIGIGLSSTDFWTVDPSTHAATHRTSSYSTTSSTWPGSNRYYEFAPSSGSGGSSPCNPTFGSNTDCITNFTLGDINNTTSANSTNGYGNYTNLSTTLTQGETVTASLTSGAGTGTHAAAVWIDFDDDGIFDSSTERVGTIGSIGASATVNISLTIPADAAIGSHTMRVVYQYNVAATSIDPCASATYGEGEDYTVVITSGCEKLSAPSFSITPGINKNTLSWSNITGNQGYKIMYANNSSFTSSTTQDIATNTTSWVHNGTGGTTYYYKILTKGDGSTNCLEGDYSGEQHAQMLSCTGLSAPNFSITQTCANKNTLSWSNIANNQGYQIMYADNSSFTGAATQNISANATSWVHNGTGGTTYYYKMLTKGNGSTYCSLGDWSSSKSKQMKKLTLTISGNTVCSGQSTTLTATPTNLCGSAKYSWSQTSGGGLQGTLTNLTVTTITATPAAGTHTYTCTVRDETTGASATASITMNSMQGPSVSFSPSTISECSSPISISADLSGTDCNSFYQWTGGSETNAYSDLSVTESGTYRLTVTNRYYQLYDMIEHNGIKAIVVVAPTLTTDGKAVPIDGDLISSSDPLYVDAINQSDYVNLKEAIIVNGGVKFDTGTRKTFKIKKGAEGGVCQSTASVVVEISQQPTMSLTSASTTTNQTICKGSAITNITYSYSGGSGTPTVSGLPTGVTYTASAGVVTISGTPTVTGTYNYTVTHSASSPCGAATKTGKIVINDPAVLTLTSASTTTNQTICQGSAITNITYSYSGGSGSPTVSGLPTGVTYTANAGVVTISGTPSVTGTFSYTVTHSASSPCTAETETGTIKVNALAVLTLTSASATANQTICQGSAITNITYSYGGGNGTPTVSGLPTGVTYTANAGVVTISGTPTVTGTFNYTVTHSAASPCPPETETGRITINTLPVVEITGTSPICSGETLTLTATSGHSSYAWGYGSATAGTQGTGSNKHIYTVSNITTGGTYSVTATNSNNCSASATKAVTVNALPSVSIDGTTPICSGQALTLTATSGHSSYVWSNGSATAGTQGTGSNKHIYTVASITTGGTYSVTATGSNGCSNTASKDITVNTPNIDASSYDYIWRGVSADWNTASNWYVYNSGYSVATELPTTAKNIYIGTGLCLATSNWPSQTGEANANNITIASGASLTIPASKTLNIAGSITNNGTFTANNSSTIVFKGSATQTLSSAMTFGNVTFAQTALDTIKAPNGITVNGTAIFNKGIVMGEMTFSAGATAANVTDSASFVAGKVTKLTGESAETNFTFPTGSAGDGQPKVLGSIKVASLPANSETYVVFNQKSNGGGFSDSEMPRWWNQNNNCEGNDPLFDHISNFEFWNVSTNSALTADLTVSANNRNAHFSPDAISYDGEDIFGAMWQGGCWKKVSDHAVVSDPKTITISGVTIPAVSTRASEPQWLSMGSKNRETLLPIELVSFTATCDGRSALVEWTTATEKNNDYFSLERSDDAINFTEIARVAGAGNSIEPLDYSYTDYGIHGGDNYYRLVQVDYDGTRTVSDIVVATCIDTEVGEPDVQAFPNPFNGELTVVLNNFDNRPARIEVYDMLGKLIYVQKAEAPQNSFETILNLSNLPPAAYNIRVSTNDFVINKNVVKN